MNSVKQVIDKTNNSTQIIEDMQACTQNTITGSCAYLENLSACASCSVTTTSGVSVMSCNGIPMTCVYGQAASGSDSNPSQAFYNIPVISNVLMVLDTTSKNNNNELTVAPSVAYTVTQVYTDNDGAFGNWMQSMVVTTPSTYMVLYENGYTNPQNLYN